MIFYIKFENSEKNINYAQRLIGCLTLFQDWSDKAFLRSVRSSNSPYYLFCLLLFISARNQPDITFAVKTMQFCWSAMRNLNSYKKIPWIDKLFNDLIYRTPAISSSSVMSESSIFRCDKCRHSDNSDILPKDCLKNLKPSEVNSSRFLACLNTF